MNGNLPPGCTQLECDQAQPGYWPWDQDEPSDEPPEQFDDWDWEDPPEEWIECGACEGEGFTVHGIDVYEHGCGFLHRDTEERPCTCCGGVGGRIEECKGD